MTRPASGQRGSAIIVVLWAIAIAALVVSAVQLSAQRQALLGREALNRIQARWAARAGMESTIAVMAYHTLNPVPDDAWAMVREMEYVHRGETLDARWEILHHADGRDWEGPMDEHSKFNINREDRSIIFQLLEPEGLTIDKAAEIMDWIDEDDEVTAFGAERDYYLSQIPPYEPRNGLFRTTAELELVAGIWPEELRGEDWNLNNRLDPNEDDSERSFPSDDPDRKLEAGWFSYLTAYSVIDGATASGQPRILLRIADPNELAERLGIDYAQAEALKAFGKQDGNRLEQLVSVQGTSAGSGALANLTREQLDAVFNETAIDSPLDRLPGKMNINTISADLLRDLLPGEEILADEILYIRDSRPEGITSLIELTELRELTSETWERLSSLLTTTSNVYTITSRGKSASGDLEIEIVAVVDRSTVPVRIIEYREQ
ncbi:MAG: general secretion pathway protein GspK [Phycisphaerales bacterium]|nr:MAG: general secretion pathway protein GspK [Phycisphaerales bacterium]